jgi:hypothetical protein
MEGRDREFTDILKELVVAVIESRNILLTELKNMDTRIQAALDRATQTITTALDTAVTKETTELKKAITDASDTAAIETAIDSFASNISTALSTAVDKISTDAAADTTQPGEGETPVP